MICLTTGQYQFNLFSKIFIKVMQTRLLKHLDDHNILSKEQHDFRTKQKSDATYQLTNAILNALNSSLLIGGIFCDLEKAYDCFNNKIILSKLEFYGITGNHYKLYKSYLTNRYQTALLYNENGIITTSTWAKIERGVPQVSVLEPLLFLIFINDLLKFVNDKSVPILFVYDTSILLPHSNPTDFNNNINIVFKILSDWFKQNLLSLNFTKTQFTNFTTKNNNQIEINIYYNDKFIPTFTYTKFLGLTVDCSLTLVYIDSPTNKN